MSTGLMRFKIFSGPGDHRDDFAAVEEQMNAWSEAQHPDVVDVRCNVTPINDQQNKGRYMMTVLVTYRPTAG